MGCFSGSKSEQKSSSFLPAQSKWLTKALGVYGPQLGKNENTWQGDRVAGFNDLQNNVMGSAKGVLQGFSGNQSVDTPLAGETGGAIANLLGGNTGAQKTSQADADRFFKDTAYDPTMRMLKNDILPTVDEGYAGGNFFGSARGKARDKVSTDVANSLAGEKANLDFNVMRNNQQIDEASANRTLNTLPAAMQYGTQPAQQTLNNLRIAASQVQGMSDLFGLGSAEQTQQQREIEASMAKFAEDNQITDTENLSILLSLLNMNYSSSTSSQSGPGLGFSGLSSMIGGAGQVAGAAGMSGVMKVLKASDRDVKENIEPLSVLDKIGKLKPHRYNYKGNPQPRIGLIAQEVEEVFPEAVTTIDGVKHVDMYALQSIIIGAIAEMGEK